MIYIILGAVFAAAVVAFYFLDQLMQGAVERTSSQKQEHVKRQLEEMFIFISVEGLHRIKWACALGLGGIGLVLTWEAAPPGPFIAGALIGWIGFYLPEIVIFFLRRRRRAAFGEQLVDGLVLMANGLRSGFTLPMAIDMLIEEMSAPISQEFELVRREVRVGVDIDEALRRCVARTRDADFELVVTAIGITRQLGGNLAEVFDRIVAMVRERKVLAGKADALTSEGKMQAMVVGLLPYVFMLMMTKVNPELMRLMWTTIPGFLCLLAVIILDTVGYLWVRKCANIEY